MKRLYYAIILTALFAFSGIAEAATVYVSNSTNNGYSVGNDSNTYTQAQSISTPWLTLTHAVAGASSGDTIVVNDSSTIYNEAASIAPTQAALTINGVTPLGATIRAASGTTSVFGPATAGTLTFGAIVIDANATQSYAIQNNNHLVNIVLNGTELINWTAQGVQLLYNGNLVSTNAIYTSSVPGATAFVQSNPNTATTAITITGGSMSMTAASGSVSKMIVYAGFGSTPTAGSTFSMSGVTVSMNLTGSTDLSYGVYLQGMSTVAMYNNTITYTGVNSSQAAFGLDINAGSLATTSCLVYGNNVNLNSAGGSALGNGFGIRLGSIPSGAYNNLISGIKVYGNTVSNAGGGIVVQNETNALVYDNYVVNCGEGIQFIETTTCKAFYNVINGAYGTYATGLLDEGGTNDIMSNNSIYMGTNSNTTVAGLISEQYATDSKVATAAVFRNNIVLLNAASQFYVNIGTNAGDTSTGILSNNIYYGATNATPWVAQTVTYATLPLWQAGNVNWDNVGTTIANPAFSNASGTYSLATDFKLSTASPAIGAGANAGNAALTAYQTDGFGLSLFWMPYDVLNIGASQALSPAATRPAGLSQF